MAVAALVIMDTVVLEELPISEDLVQVVTHKEEIIAIIMMIEVLLVAGVVVVGQVVMVVWGLMEKMA